MFARQEKRKTPRVPVSMHVSGEPVGFGYAVNISEGGLAVDAQALIDAGGLPRIGNELRMRFKLPKSDLVITVVGKVVRVDQDKTTPPRFGVEFLDATPEIKNEIRRYITNGDR